MGATLPSCRRRPSRPLKKKKNRIAAMVHLFLGLWDICICSLTGFKRNMSHMGLRAILVS